MFFALYSPLFYTFFLQWEIITTLPSISVPPPRNGGGILQYFPMRLWSVVAGGKHSVLLNTSSKCLIWPLRQCWGYGAGSALCDEVPWAFRLLQPGVEAYVNKGTLIVALFFWVEIRSFLTRSIFTIGKAHPVNGRQKEFDPILDACDSSATWVWLLDFSHLTKKSHLRVWGYSRCWL